MSTNFLQWNPGANNQDSDAEYAADAQRSNGAQNGQIFDDKTANKLFYQSSTFIAAFGQMMSSKGYNPNDTSLGTLQSVLANVLTNADLKAAQINVPYSPNPVFNAAIANGFRIDLAGNVTSSSLINGTTGQIVTFYIVSGSPGNFSFAWPSNVVNPFSVQTASMNNLLVEQFICDGGNWFPCPTILNFLNSRADANATAAGNAQNTANNATNLANAAQGTANTALTNANNAQGTANTANGTANTALTNANTALAQIAGLINQGALGGDGWIGLPAVGSLLIVQWKTGSAINSSVTVTQNVPFPRTFPSQCFKVLVTDQFIGGADNDIMAWQATAWDANGVNVRRARRGDDNSYNSAPIILAIGN